ncbi:MAG: polyprenyl synthetase family protein [Anaerolineales bacterium]
MDVFEKVVVYVKEKDLFGEWVEMMDIFEDIAAKEPTGWDIVLHACIGVGGTLDQAVPGVAAIGCLQVAILILDDMLDHDPHGIYREIGEGQAANMASSFQSAGLQVILDEDLPAATKIAAVSSLNKMMGTTALGQMLDVRGVNNEADYWDVVRKKSSPYCRAALHTGALLGGVSLETGEQIRALGVVYGELLQIHDDLKDTLKTPAEPDWLNWHPTLPILFAQVVDHPDRERFIALRDTIAEPESLREAQTILIRCGAISYSLDQLITRYQKAKEILAEIDVANPDSFELLFEDMIEPAREMVKALGMTNQLDDLIDLVNN